jgi:hypothetical protein
VRKLQARDLKEGEAALRRGGRGGRYYQNLTLEEDRQLLQEFLAQSERDGVMAGARSFRGTVTLSPMPPSSSPVAQAFQLALT